MIKIYIASDHGGLELKSKVLMELRSSTYANHYETHDLGPQSNESVDYPDYADLVCKKMHGLRLINSNDTGNKDQSVEYKHFPVEFGILICGSGQGMAMRANKYLQIRAALCWTPEIAKLAREHNDANILCLGARVTDHELCLKIMQEFLKTNFAGGRHRQRLVKVSSPV